MEKYYVKEQRQDEQAPTAAPMPPCERCSGPTTAAQWAVVLAFDWVERSIPDAARAVLSVVHAAQRVLALQTSKASVAIAHTHRVAEQSPTGHEYLVFLAGDGRVVVAILDVLTETAIPVSRSTAVPSPAEAHREFPSLVGFAEVSAESFWLVPSKLIRREVRSRPVERQVRKFLIANGLIGRVPTH